MTRNLGLIGICFAALLTACGGGGGSSSASAGTPGGGGGTTNPGGGVVTPTVVTVGAGQTTSGVDITVPSTTPALNSEVLGVASLSAGGGTAFSTGDSIPRGTTGKVLMFGKGLNGNLQITISGPNDITVSNPQTIKATDGTPGISFTVAVSGTATPGARTVYLRDSSDNITAFTGGLEVK